MKAESSRPALINVATIVTLAALLSAASSGVQATSGVQGTQTTTDRQVTSSATWTVLSSKAINLSGTKSWYCAATASADPVNPQSGVQNRYLFTLTVDSPAPLTNGPCERTVEFSANSSVDDPDITAIQSACLLGPIAPGAHTIFWLASKQAKTPEAPDMRVEDNGFTVSCSNTLL